MWEDTLWLLQLKIIHHWATWSILIFIFSIYNLHWSLVSHSSSSVPLHHLHLQIITVNPSLSLISAWLAALGLFVMCCDTPFIVFLSVSRGTQSHFIIVFPSTSPFLIGSSLEWLLGWNNLCLPRHSFFPLSSTFLFAASSSIMTFVLCSASTFSHSPTLIELLKLTDFLSAVCN